MKQRMNSFLSRAVIGTIIGLFALASCTPKSFEITDRAAELESAGGPVAPAPDVLVESISDGDHQVKTYAPASEVPNFSGKVYFNGSTVAKGAPRWKTNTIDWYYNPKGVPGNLSETALETIQASFDYWTSKCNLNFYYMGTTNKSTTLKDGTNVVGWEELDNLAGVARAGFTLSGSTYIISETDVAFDRSEILDEYTLFAIANHEIGHMLGLLHSNVADSIMFASPYHPIPFLEILRKDDISGCTDLYGKPIKY